ncbi:MAG: alpha-amylase family glycosyl hydrolase [Pseudomonadota bacterium]|nr:alpha-amylase family glycosyl hydrolase [Pseudomonadota bacterium]
MSQNWWDNAVIYQIYPRSFADSNSDGVGDLNGITGKLDYIADLGVDAIWISPFFVSPMKDFGYDVADYRAVDPIFGTNADFDRLLEQAHNRGLKVLIDMVLAHCSDQHPWFVESRTSRDNPKADWFYWLDPKKDATEPNNWMSFFGGRTWTWDTARQQYYFHNFLPSQPNLNLSNPEVLEAMIDTCRFWLNKGVDGFRLDAIHTAKLDNDWTDNSLRPRTDGIRPEREFDYQAQDSAQLNQPSIQTLSARLRQLVDEYGDRFLMGELDGEDAVAVSKTFTEPGRLHSTYNFNLLQMEGSTVAEVRDIIGDLAQNFNDSNAISVAWSNHDIARVYDRMKRRIDVPEAYADDFAHMLFQLSTSLIGSTCVYQGEELGLDDADRLSLDQLQDPWGVARYSDTFKGRDTCRTPMPWTQDQPNTGFSGDDLVESWLPIDERHKSKGGLDQQGKQGSMFERNKAHLSWRRNQPALTRNGQIQLIDGGDNVIAFNRLSHDRSQTMLCLFNFSSQTESVEGVDIPPWSSAFR